MTRPEIEALRRLYGNHHDVAAATFAAQLNDIGECLAAQLAQLGQDFTADRAERMCIALQGVQDAIRRMMREVR